MEIKWSEVAVGNLHPSRQLVGSWRWQSLILALSTQQRSTATMTGFRLSSDTIQINFNIYLYW
jgi:hypothetical protein